MAQKNCFMNAQRPCDLTCKAAFEVDDPVDNIDCYFIWVAYHMGEGFFEMKRSLEGGPPGFPGGPGAGPGSTPPSSGGSSGAPGAGGKSPKGPKGFPNN
jgi:hypothetical protein